MKLQNDFSKKKRQFGCVIKIVYSEYIFKSELYNNIMLKNLLYKNNIHINNIKQ